MARERFRTTLQTATGIVSTDWVHDAGDRFRFGAEIVALDRDRTYALSFRHFFLTVATPSQRAAWIVRTVGYSYTLLDQGERELVAYHWHLAGRSPVVWPHLHVGAGMIRSGMARPFERVHWPTEPITIAAFVRVLVDDLGVEPLRADWRTRLETADAALRTSFAVEG